MHTCNYCGCVLKHDYEKCPNCGGSSFSNKSYLGEEIITTPPKDGYKINISNYKKTIRNCNIGALCGVLFMIGLIILLSPFILIGFAEPAMSLVVAIPLFIGIIIIVGIFSIKKATKKELKKALKLAHEGILIKNMPYEAIETGTMVAGHYYKCIQVKYKNSAGIEIPLYSETKYNMEDKMKVDDTADLLIDPDDYSNYFIDFEIF